MYWDAGVTAATLEACDLKPLRLLAGRDFTQTTKKALVYTLSPPSTRGSKECSVPHGRAKKFWLYSNLHLRLMVGAETFQIPEILAGSG